MTGTLTLSMEIELGWGIVDGADGRHLSEDGSAERTYLRRLLRKTEACGVPITFDVVGHLMLRSCPGTHPGPYPDGWFDRDPGTDLHADPLFYAPDMVEEVAASSADHEICTHTFSHIRCGAVADELIDLELQRAQRLHERYGGRVESFVPPLHSEPPNPVVRRNGITTVRYARERQSPTRLNRLKELTTGPHPEWPPQVVDEVLESYCTTYPSLTARSLPAGRRDTHPVFRSLPIAVRKRAHAFYLRRAIERAVASGTPLHLWCHLFDLCNPHQWAVVSDFLEYLGELPADELAIRTMADLPPRTVAGVGARQ